MPLLACHCSAQQSDVVIAKVPIIQRFFVSKTPTCHCLFTAAEKYSNTKLYFGHKLIECNAELGTLIIKR